MKMSTALLVCALSAANAVAGCGSEGGGSVPAPRRARHDAATPLSEAGDAAAPVDGALPDADAATLPKRTAWTRHPFGN